MSYSFPSSDWTDVQKEIFTKKGPLTIGDGTKGAELPIGQDGYVLTADSSTLTGTKWAYNAASGDVSSSISSTTANAVARFDGTTGKIIKNSLCTIGNNGDLTANIVHINSANGFGFSFGTTVGLVPEFPIFTIGQDYISGIPDTAQRTKLKLFWGDYGTKGFQSMPVIYNMSQAITQMLTVS